MSETLKVRSGLETGLQCHAVYFFLSDFYFGERPLTKQQCLQNLNKVEGMYSTLLSPGAFHLSPGEIIKWSQSNILGCNIQALLAHLYYSFEVCHTSSLHNSSVKSLKSASVSQMQAIKSHEDINGLSKQQILLRKDKLLSKADNTLKTGRIPHSGLHSFSTSDLNPPTSGRNLVSRRSIRPLVGDGQSIGRDSDHSLSSFSASALIVDCKEKSDSGVQSSSTVFKAPIRSSLTASQAATLTKFDRRSIELGKGPHTQSSPAIHITTTLPDPPKPSKRDIITASADNLMIREQMLTKKLKRTAPKRADSKPTKPQNLVMPHQSNSSHSDINSCSDDEFTTSSPGADVSGNCTASWNAAAVNQQFHDTGTRLTGGQTLPCTPLETDPPNFPGTPSRPVPPDVKFSTVPPLYSLQLQAVKPEAQEEMKRSFTLDKQHTIATASAAGLPIIGKDYNLNETEPISQVHINPSEPPSQTTRGEPHLNHSSPSKQPHVQDKPSSISSSTSSPTMMCLDFYSELQANSTSSEKSPTPTVPASIVEQLHLVLNTCRTTQTVQEKTLLTKRRKVGQKLHLSFVQRTKENSTSNTTVHVDPHHKQVHTRQSHKDSHISLTPANVTHCIPRDPPQQHTTTKSPSKNIHKAEAQVHSLPKAEPSDILQNTGDMNVLLPHSSTAKKLHSHPLREIPLSPIAQSEPMHSDNGNKPSGEMDLSPKSLQRNPWTENAGGVSQTDMVNKPNVVLLVE